VQAALNFICRRVCFSGGGFHGDRVYKISRIAFVLGVISAGCATPWLVGQDSAPQVISKKGGGVAWKNVAELKAAASAGNSQAQAQLGEQLLRGEGMPRDVPQALELLEKAARAGIPSAAFRVGMLLDDGDGVAQDRVRALSYFRAAAAGDFAEAYHNIGAAYAGAHGVKRDYAEALGWLVLAKKHGVGADSEQAVRARIQRLNHPEWIAAGEKRATEIVRELAEKPVANFLPPPAPLVFSGSSGSAASAGTPGPAAPPATGEVVALSAVKVTGSGEEPSVEQLEESAKSGSADAAQRLAELYTKGGKVPADATKAFQYNLQAARGGSVPAMYNTGAFLSNGMGTTRDLTEALAWLIVAKQNGRDLGAEKTIRDYLAKNAPEQIAVAEQRATALQREIKSARDGTR
jgi:uncharacterized protein